MRAYAILILFVLLAGCATPPAAPLVEQTATALPTATEDPISPMMRTAAARSTELAQATLDPQKFPTPTQRLTATPSAEWQLVWADEFDGADGSAPDPQTWTHEIGGHGWGNNEKEYYTDRIENAYLKDGALVIEARQEDYEGAQYTSARLVTRGKAEWQYGRFEIRAKLPRGQGIWPAIWMMPTDSVYGDWPLSGEIDIMELLGHAPQTVYGTLHWGVPKASSGTSYVLYEPETFADDFHVFALEWQEDEMRWYVDGVHFHTVRQWMTSGGNGAPFPAPFDQKFHIILNVAVGGNWPGSPNSSTQFPQQMLVDYVRVYQAP